MKSCDQRVVSFLLWQSRVLDLNDFDYFAFKSDFSNIVLNGLHHLIEDSLKNERSPDLTLERNIGIMSFGNFL